MKPSKLMLLAGSTFAILLSACGENTPNQILSTDQVVIEDTTAPAQSKDPSSNDDVSAKLTWNNGANKIFGNNCGTCHSTWALDFNLFKAKKDKIISRINSKTNPMPPSNTPKWLADKEQAIEYLSSEELK